MTVAWTREEVAGVEDSEQVRDLFEGENRKDIQVYLRDTAGLVTDSCNKVTIIIKQVM